MSTSPSHVTVPLDALLLDPNNFRFRNQDRWRMIPDEKFGEAAIQWRALTLVAGPGNTAIADVMSSIRVNGWLPVDQIQVCPYPGDRYVVVEGNRRVASLLTIRAQFKESGEPLGELDPSVFDTIPVVVQEQEDRVQHLIHMGLVHISGKRPWHPMTQSMAIRELVEDHGLTERKAAKCLSISLQEVRLSLRALHLCDAYQESDWGDQFTADKYAILREAVRNRAIKAWLDWDEQTYHARDPSSLSSFFSLISQVEDEVLDEESDSATEVVTIRREAALRNRDHVRRLGHLLDAGDRRAIRNLEESRDITAAEQSSEELGRDRVRNAVALIDEQANGLFQNIGYIGDAHLAQLQASIQKLAGLWVATGQDLNSLLDAIQATRVPNEPDLDHGQSAPARYLTGGLRHFNAIFIEKYRGIERLKLDGLRQINILAGLNNAGKTTVVEAIRLLTSLSEPTALLDILRRRGRMNDLDMPWIAKHLSDRVLISGDVGEAVRVAIHASTDHATRTRNARYLRSVHINAVAGKREEVSTTHLYAGPPGRTTERTGTTQICPIVHSSPFSSQDPGMLAALYDAAVESGLDKQVVTLLNQELDPGLESIKLTAGPPLRFRVSRSGEPPPDGMDLGMYGDGLQRLFHIGLQFAHARDGIVLIDELENAIHASLLGSVARLIHELACRFNAQVFLTTHSKECIDAFVAEDSIAASVRGFSLGFSGKDRAVEGIDGEELKRLVDLIDVDLRAWQ